MKKIILVLSIFILIAGCSKDEKDKKKFLGVWEATFYSEFGNVERVDTVFFTEVHTDLLQRITEYQIGSGVLNTFGSSFKYSFRSDNEIFLEQFNSFRNSNVTLKNIKI